MIKHNINYAIPPDKESWIERVESGCLALETAYPSIRLNVAHADEDHKPDRLIADRLDYLQERLKRDGWLFCLYNGSSVRSVIDDRYVGVLGLFNEANQIMYDFVITFETETWLECERIFVSVGDAVEAYSATTSPSAANRALYAFEGVRSKHYSSLYLNRPNDVQTAERLSAALAVVGRQLPRFDDNPRAARDHPAQPMQLGWLNYWSAQTCEYLGFPDPERDRDLLVHSYRTPLGAWLVKLCPEPLDLNRPDHLAIFADIYERFPKLGIRAPESEPDEPLPMSYPQNTVFIHESNPWYIVDRLIPFLRERGLQIVECIPEAAETQSLTVGLFPGAPDWTIIKTIPKEYLAEKTPGAGEPRLVELCRAIQRDGFMLNVYNPIEAVLLETDGAGRMHVSGFRDVDGESEAAGDLEKLASENPSVVGFELLPIAVDMLNLNDCGQLAQQIYRELAVSNADLCDNERFAAAVNSKLLQNRQGVKLRFIPLSDHQAHIGDA